MADGGSQWLTVVSSATVVRFCTVCFEIFGERPASFEASACCWRTIEAEKGALLTTRSELPVTFLSALPAITVWVMFAIFLFASFPPSFLPFIRFLFTARLYLLCSFFIYYLLFHYFLWFGQMFHATGTVVSEFCCCLCWVPVLFFFSIWQSHFFLPTDCVHSLFLVMSCASIATTAGADDDDDGCLDVCLCHNKEESFLNGEKGDVLRIFI